VMSLEDHSSSFTAVKVNDTTFAVTEDDSYEERPIIYVKIHPQAPLIILSDTGSNSPAERSKKARYTHLLDFLRHCPIPENDDKPLDPLPRHRHYVIICSHCHFDHICGIEQFVPDNSSPGSEDEVKDSQIVVSAKGRDFVTHDLATHSLCKLLYLPTPKYKVSLWAEDGAKLYYSPTSDPLLTTAPSDDGVDLGITIFNTPGHVPDELAFYDHKERHLYVGDSFYELGDQANSKIYQGPIIFPNEGSWVDYIPSMKKLLSFVMAENRKGGPRVKVGAGHATVAADAEQMITEVLVLFGKIVAGEVKEIKSEESRGEEHVTWQDDGSKYAVRAPRRLCEEIQGVNSKEEPLGEYAEDSD